MPPDDEIRVRHLVEAASKAVSYAAGRSRADLDDDELLRLVLTKLVEIVGEAAKHVSHDLPRLLAILPNKLVSDRSVPRACDQRHPGER